MAKVACNDVIIYMIKLKEIERIIKKRNEEPQVIFEKF